MGARHQLNLSIFKKVLSVGSGKLASELNTVVDAINNKEQELLRKKLQWERKSAEIINNYLSQYKDLEWSEIVPSTEERVEFSGKILNTKYQENQFGGSLKMLFQDERGFKLWGSVPNKLLEENLENLKIKFIIYNSCSYLLN